MKAAQHRKLRTRRIRRKLYKQCRVKRCSRRAHGVFMCCKSHLKRAQHGRATFSWTPSSVGIQTLLSLDGIHETFDLSAVHEGSVDRGGDSRIPLTCRKCGYSWKPSIRSVVNEGSGCPGCSRCARWSYPRLMVIAKEKGMCERFDFGYVQEHDVQGHTSRIPLKCRACGYMWKTSIQSVVNEGSGCPSCAGCVQWSYDRLLSTARTKGLCERFDFRAVEENDVQRHTSRIPLKCMACGHVWKPSIRSVMNEGSGCPHCQTSRMELRMEKCLVDLLEPSESEDHREWSILEINSQWRMRGSCAGEGTRTRDLRADFMLKVSVSDTVKTVVLETDGVQHFSAGHWGEGVLERTRERDIRKDKWCTDHACYLIRVGNSINPGRYRDLICAVLDYFSRSQGVRSVRIGREYGTTGPNKETLIGEEWC